MWRSTKCRAAAIISTEQLLEQLARTSALRPGARSSWSARRASTPPTRAPTRDAERIPQIDAANIAAVLRGAGASHGVDVTGGMRGKVELMWRLVEATPGLTVQLIGTAPGLLARALLGAADGEGTLIAA